MLFAKIKIALLEKRFAKTVKKKLYPYFRGLLCFFSFKKIPVKIYISKNQKIDKKDLPLAERIFKSYRLMKSEQNNKSTLYKPSSLWQSQINESYSFLLESFEKNDIEKFLYFLQNFGIWDKYLGVENQNLIKKYNKNLFLKKFLTDEVFGGQLDLWRSFNKKRDLNDLDFPRHGNQIGAFVENKFLVIGSCSNQMYAEILQHYLNKKKNIVLELGGGYGKLAYYMLKQNFNITYFNFDIPETLVLSSYYLSKCFPNKNNFFYGEANFNRNISLKYDLIFLPSWEIENIDNDSVNLAINKNSLGEMDPDAAENYLKHIHRTSKYFFSMNHEYFRNYFSDGKKSLINSEYNLNGRFKQLIRYYDLGHGTYENNRIDYDSNIFFYIFKKNKII